MKWGPPSLTFFWPSRAFAPLCRSTHAPENRQPTSTQTHIAIYSPRSQTTRPSANEDNKKTKKLKLVTVENGDASLYFDVRMPTYDNTVAEASKTRVLRSACTCQG